MARPAANIIPIESVIQTVRGEKIILDADLARIYGVTTKRLNEQVKRNPDRFPSDFVFRLTQGEWERLAGRIANSDRPENRSQIATGSQRHRDPRFPPYAFTEHGAIMAANVLVRSHPAAHDPTGAQETEDRISGAGESGAVRKRAAAGHFDVSTIVETWKCA